MSAGAASMESFAQTLKRLQETMSQQQADGPALGTAQREALDNCSGAVLKLCTVLDSVAAAEVQDEAEEKSPEQAARAGRGWRRISPAGLTNLKRHFDVVDTDQSGALSSVEISDMLRRIGLGGEEVLKVFADVVRHDDNADDSTSFNEFAEWFNTLITNGDSLAITLSDETIAALEQMQTSMRKVGYGGTSWRTFQNTIWLLTQAVMIMCGSTIFVGIVWFRFILVPMTMAYFLTFLVGPIIDVMTQRPLILLGRVYCKINKLPEDQAQAVWAKKGSRRPLPHPSHLDYPYDEGAGVCCHTRPPPNRNEPGVTAEQLNHSMHQWLTVGKLPFPLALILTIVFIFLFFRFAFLLISNDIQTVLQDDKFMDAFEELLQNTASRLKHEAGIVVTDFEPKMIRKNLEGNTTCMDSMMDDSYTTNFQAVEVGNGTECIQVQEFSSEEFSAMLSPYLVIVNDLVLTLLLCLYLLSARSARGEFDRNRATHLANKLTVMEKIEMMNRNYVLLKTKLSALTAGLVMLILGLLSIKLWFIWGLLTFAFNFIPNVGSLIAMVLPVPVILVDEQLGVAKQAAAIVLPALVQAYVGNVLEPQMFGKSLNLTAISVLIGLVFWSAIWGMAGAVLSVPLLGVMKILLDDTDYPLAKRFLALMREDSTIDEEKISREMIRQLAGYQQEHAYLVAGESVENQNPVADET